MSEKCFCHLNGYAVKDATARKDIATLQDEVFGKMELLTTATIPNDIEYFSFFEPIKKDFIIFVEIPASEVPENSRKAILEVDGFYMGAVPEVVRADADTKTKIKCSYNGCFWEFESFTKTDTTGIAKVNSYIGPAVYPQSKISELRILAYFKAGSKISIYAVKDNSAYNTILNPAELIKDTLPEKAIHYETNKTANTTPGHWFKWGDETPHSYFDSEFKSPWAFNNKWGKAPLFLLGLENNSISFAFGGADEQMNKYYSKFSLENNSIVHNTWATALNWRTFFEAPDTGTYFIYLSPIKVTDPNAIFRIYKDSALDSDRNLTSDSEAIKFFNYQEANVKEWNPCENGSIAVHLEAGERVYFESEFLTGAKQYNGSSLLSANFDLTIKAFLNK